MNFKLAIFFVFVGMFISFPIAADDAQKPNIKTIQEKPAFCFDAEIILDPKISLENKRKEIAILQLSADSGNSQSQYLLGSFYRLGEKHPAKIFMQDIEKAKIYLSNAAIGGNYAAMAGMAELELSNKNYKEAIFWAQIFAHYSETERMKNNLRDSNQAYQAYLLQRVMELSKKDKALYTEQMLLADLASFHANYNEKIVDSQSVQRKKADASKFNACKYNNQDEELHDIKMVSGPSINAGQLTSRMIPSPGYAYYLLVLDPNGKVKRTLIVDSMPDVSYAKALSYVATQIRFNSVKGSSIRTVYIPLSFDDHSVAIKKESAKK
jgi:hypothetical protein